MSAQKRAALGKGIFDRTQPEDPATAKQAIEKRRQLRQNLELQDTEPTKEQLEQAISALNAEMVELDGALLKSTNQGIADPKTT